MTRRNRRRKRRRAVRRSVRHRAVLRDVKIARGKSWRDDAGQNAWNLFPAGSFLTRVGFNGRLGARAADQPANQQSQNDAISRAADIRGQVIGAGRNCLGIHVSRHYQGRRRQSKAIHANYLEI